MQEIHQPEKNVQLMFPTFKLDRESEICRDPFSYLRGLTDTVQSNRQDEDTAWLKGKDYSISVSPDAFYEIGALEPEPPFVTVAIWPKKWMGSMMTEKCYIDSEGTIKHHISEKSESMINSHLLPELTEIKWKNIRHEHAARVALFVESHTPNNYSS